MHIVTRPSIVPPSVPAYRRVRDRVVGLWHNSEWFPLLVLAVGFWTGLALLFVAVLRAI